MQDGKRIKTQNSCLEDIGDVIMNRADEIRSMTDEELAEWITNMCEFERHGEPYKSIYNLDTYNEEEIHDSYGDLLIWLKAEREEQ